MPVVLNRCFGGFCSYFLLESKIFSMNYHAYSLSNTNRKCSSDFGIFLQCQCTTFKYRYFSLKKPLKIKEKSPNIPMSVAYIAQYQSQEI